MDEELFFEDEGLLPEPDFFVDEEEVAERTAFFADFFIAAAMIPTIATAAAPI